MDSTAAAASILSLLAGIGIFLIACKMMSDNLESIGSDKLRAMFAKASRSKLIGVGIGTVGTAAIQSSGATTVMVIGFVNAGIMTLSQAAAIVFGANIGTTITAHIVALGLGGGNSVSTTVIFSAFTCLGALLAQKSKSDTVKTIGGIITGFGMLFIGLSMMSSSMEGFAQLEGVRTFLASIKNGALLILTGAILTAIIQSSSVMTSVAITMLVTGLITLDQGIFLTMGSNIGSCVVSVIASITSGANAKRTAAIHLIFNIGGVILFTLIGLAIRFFTGGSVSLGSIFEGAFPGAPQTQLAVFHTVFNVVAVIVALPLSDMLVAFVTRLIPEGAPVAEPDSSSKIQLHYVDENMLATPVIAVAQVKTEIANMAGIARDNFRSAMNMAATMDFKGLPAFEENERELDHINRDLVRFITKLLNERLGEIDQAYLSGAFHTISDLERVGDYAENIVEYSQSLSELGQTFAPAEVVEIKAAEELIEDLYEHALSAYMHGDDREVQQAYDAENRVNDITDKMAENYIERMSEGACTPESGTRFYSLAMDTERVGDHFVNIAKAAHRPR